MENPRPASLCPEKACDLLKDAQLSKPKLEPKLLKFPNFHFPAAHRESSLGPEGQPGSASQGL